MFKNNILKMSYKKIIHIYNTKQFFKEKNITNTFKPFTENSIFEEPTVFSSESETVENITITPCEILNKNYIILNTYDGVIDASMDYLTQNYLTLKEIALLPLGVSTYEIAETVCKCLILPEAITLDKYEENIQNDQEKKYTLDVNLAKLDDVKGFVMVENDVPKIALFYT